MTLHAESVTHLRSGTTAGVCDRRDGGGRYPRHVEYSSKLRDNRNIRRQLQTTGKSKLLFVFRFGVGGIHIDVISFLPRMTLGGSAAGASVDHDVLGDGEGEVFWETAATSLP